MLTPAEFTHGTHHLSWNGHVPPGGPFPDGYITVGQSAYRLIVTVQGHGGPQPQPEKAWTFFHVKIADIELALGPREMLTGPTAHHDLLVYDQFHGALPAPGTTHLLKLRSNLFKATMPGEENDGLQMYDNTGYSKYESLWGAGPRIPIFATVWIENSSGHKVLSPKALGKTRFLWDWEDVPEEVGHVHPQAQAYLAETVDYYKNVPKPGERPEVKPHPADNCHVDYGGKRGAGHPVFLPLPPEPGVTPSPASDWPHRRWAGSTDAWTKGRYASRTGTFFQPSRMAGDAWRVTVYVVHEKNGHLDIDVPDPPPLKAIAKKSTGVFLTYREVQIARYLSKTPKVVRADLATVRGYYEEARIKLTGPTKFESMTKTDYDSHIKAAVHHVSSQEPFPFLEKYAIDPSLSQHVGTGTAVRPSPCAVTFRTFAQLKNFIHQENLANLNARGLHGPAAEATASAQTSFFLNQSLVPTEKLYKARCTKVDGWAMKILTEACAHYLGAVTEGIVVLQFDALCNFAAGILGIAVNLLTSTHSRCAFLSVAPRNSYSGDLNRTPKKDDTLEKTLAHEIGHHLFLPHSPYGNPLPYLDQQGNVDPVEEANEDKRHDHSDSLCMMTYNRADLHFCGLCVLRLRGWNADLLHNHAKQNKKP